MEEGLESIATNPRNAIIGLSCRLLVLSWYSWVSADSRNSVHRPAANLIAPSLATGDWPTDHRS